MKFKDRKAKAEDFKSIANLSKKLGYKSSEITFLKQFLYR